MTQQNLVPKFGSVKRPETKPEAAESGEKKGPNQRTMPPQKEISMNVIEVSEKTEVAASENAPKVSYPQGRWTLFKNPFHPKVISTTEKAPVQGELSLESVKPMRNDLHDSDLEIVAGTAPVKPADAPVATGEAASVSWGRIASRIFGAKELKS